MSLKCKTRHKNLVDLPSSVLLSSVNNCTVKYDFIFRHTLDIQKLIDVLHVYVCVCHIRSIIIIIFVIIAISTKLS